MEEFWGVDDPEDRKRLREAALRRDGFAKRLCTFFGIAGAVGFTVSLASFWLPNLLGSDSTIRSMLIGALAAWAILTWQRRRVRENMRGVLRSEGRCEHCGYKLLSENAGKCPECGQEQRQYLALVKV